MKTRDILSLRPIVSINGGRFSGLPKEKGILIRDYLITTCSHKHFVVHGASVKSIQNHMFDGSLGYDSIEAIPFVLKEGLVISPWDKAHDKRGETCVKCAPVRIKEQLVWVAVVLERYQTNRTANYWITSVRAIDVLKMRKLLIEVRHSFANEDVQYQKDNYQKFVTKVVKRFVMQNTPSSIIEAFINEEELEESLVAK